MGGGQPRSKDPDVRTKRLSGLYTEDESKTLRKSHENPFVQSLYSNYLGEAGGHISHELLHTHYVKRGTFNELSGVSYSIEPDPEHKRKVQPRESSGPADTPTVQKPSVREVRDEQQQVAPRLRLLELTAENARLQGELADAAETIEILKGVFNKNK